MVCKSTGMAGGVISTIKPEYADTYAAKSLLGSRQPISWNFSRRRKGKRCLWQRIAFGIENVIDELDRTEVAQNNQRSCIWLGPSSETSLPLSWSGSKTQPWFLDMQKHRVERCDVTKPRREFK